jgi:hypothetical protein
MATELNVTCVNRNADWNITHIWGQWWTHDFVKAIYNIENDIYTYKVNDRTPIVIMQDAVKWKYLKSENNKVPEDNLDNLNWCHIYGK